jgi:hypothetical protein
VIIPWRRDEALGRDVPCTITEAPAVGYFVSQTAVVVDDSRDICDQTRYLDSLTFNAQVLPRAANWRAQGVVTDGTDLVVARDAQTGRIAFGINGDVGPKDKLGEGSIAFVAALAGVTLTGSEGAGDIRRLVRPDVEYLVFPTRDVRKLAGAGYRKPTSTASLPRRLLRGGGEERLAACRSLAR